MDSVMANTATYIATSVSQDINVFFKRSTLLTSFNNSNEYA
jgi:hypothetical protein